MDIWTYNYDFLWYFDTIIQQKVIIFNNWSFLKGLLLLTCTIKQVIFILSLGFVNSVGCEKNWHFVNKLNIKVWWRVITIINDQEVLSAFAWKPSSSSSVFFFLNNSIISRNVHGCRICWLSIIQASAPRRFALSALELTLIKTMMEGSEGRCLSQRRGMG